MLQQNSKTIEATIQVIEREANAYIGSLEQKLEEAKGQRLTESYQKDLETHIEQARGAYDAILDPKRKELEAARAAEAQALQESVAQMEANAAQVKENMKAQMLAAWIQVGGDPDVFDQVFPQMYAAEMSKRALGQMGDQGEESQARRRTQSVINRNF
jgi:hypothetical protein